MINEMDIEKMSLDPPTNRGPVMTNGSVFRVFLLFDWIQVTIHPFLSDFNAEEIKDLGPDDYLKQIKNKYFYDESNVRIHSVYDLFWYLFRIDRSKVLFNQEKALFGYEFCYSFQNIKIFESATRPDMGLHIYMTGTACREFEALGLDYDDLFYKLKDFNPNYTRIDVSYDDFTGKYWTLERVYNCLHNLEVVSKFRSCLTISKDDLLNLENIGFTLQFGSRSSDIQFTFYDKLKERRCNNVEVDDNIKHWNRFETRFRCEKANAVIDNYMYYSDKYKGINSSDVVITCSSFDDYIKSVINNYISFRSRSFTDSRRSRWPFQSWWSDFLGNCDKVQFQKKPVEYSITKKRSWIDRSVSYSNFQVLLADIPDISVDEILSQYLYDLFKTGFNKLEEKDLQYINEYRIIKGYNPLELKEIDDFVDSVKEVLLKRS